MSIADVISPQLYAWWVPALAVAALAVAGVLLWWSLRRRPPRTVQSPQQAAATRATYLNRFEAEYARFERGELDLRGFHLRVASLVREFGSQRMGRDLTAMSRSEVEEAYPRVGIAVLLRRCEQPSFAPDSRAQARTTMDQVREVVAKW